MAGSDALMATQMGEIFFLRQKARESFDSTMLGMQAE